MVIILKLVLNPGFLSDGNVVRVNHAWEEQKEAKKQVDNDGSVVSFHQVNRERRAPVAHQVGQKVNVIQGEKVANGHRSAANAKEEVDPVLRVTFAVQKDPDVGEAHSKKSLHARHLIIIIWDTLFQMLLNDW